MGLSYIIDYITKEIKSSDTNNYFFNLIIFMHFHLFENITSKAGEFRKLSDINQGKVFFGGIEQREQKTKYSGSSPDHIVNDVNVAIANLNISSQNPIYDAMMFYQRFVFCHPFYDANGRIARLAVNIFLNYHGYYIDWKSLLDKGKFYKKLNKCHDRINQPMIYKEYFEYLVDYVSQFIHKKPVEECDDTH